MSVSDKFRKFSSDITIPQDVADDISYRYRRITEQLNKDFWNNDSDTSHSLYVGSYGRNTAIHVSDIDMLFRLPYEYYQSYDKYSTNGQSALLSDVRDSIRKTYNTTHISGDGQVVKLNFTDGVSFEIVPCFINNNESYTYPDTNNGGSWKTTDPMPEIKAIREGDEAWNYNLKRLCRMARAWKDEWNVPMGGLLIDSLAYQFMRNWQYRDKSFIYYDYMVRDFFKYLKNQDPNKQYWLAPGSSQYVYRKGNFEYKAIQCFNLAVSACSYESGNQNYSANTKWREIFGAKFMG